MHLVYDWRYILQIDGCIQVARWRGSRLGIEARFAEAIPGGGGDRVELSCASCASCVATLLSRSGKRFVTCAIVDVFRARVGPIIRLFGSMSSGR